MPIRRLNDGTWISRARSERSQYIPRALFKPESSPYSAFPTFAIFVLRILQRFFAFCSSSPISSSTIRHSLCPTGNICDRAYLPCFLVVMSSFSGSFADSLSISGSIGNVAGYRGVVYSDNIPGMSKEDTMVSSSQDTQTDPNRAGGSATSRYRRYATAMCSNHGAGGGNVGEDDVDAPGRGRTEVGTSRVVACQAEVGGTADVETCSSGSSGLDIGFLKGEPQPVMSDNVDNISDVYRESEYREYSSSFPCVLAPKPGRVVDNSPYTMAGVKTVISEADLAQIRTLFEVPSDVHFWVPSLDERADHPLRDASP